jgi:two-component system, NarL family, sensor histidine kinase UhpB
LSVRGSLDGLSETLTLTLYRLIQEGLTIYKHAKAAHAEITVERVPCIQSGIDELHVTVGDDGCGMEQNARASRFD